MAVHDALQHMKKYHLWIIALMAVVALTGPAGAEMSEYTLIIERKPVTISGNTVAKITINGSIPGPTLRFTEGDEAVIHVTNKMEEDTSVHWHGILLPDNMDGVPGFGGFHGIKPGETFTYRFDIRQNGTYWYHAHSVGQEQDGHYGSIVISPKDKDPVEADRDYVVLFSDYTDEESGSIMSNLKMNSEYYQYARRTVADFFSDVREKGFGKAWANAKVWGRMRMLPTDLSDVSGYTFLVNGMTPEQNWTGLFRRGERLRLRFINASAMSFYDVRIPGLKITIVAADGQNIEPLEVDEFRFGVAETYDAIVTPEEEKAYTIVAESIDRTGFALATLAPREGMRGTIPVHRPRALLTIADMGIGHEGHDVGGNDHFKTTHNMEDMDHTVMDHAVPASRATDYDTGVPGSGWAETGAPAGTGLLAYRDIRSLSQQKDVRLPEHEIEIRLGGNMNRYVWTLNGKKFSEAVPISLSYGGRVRLKFINETMMAHTMHLHGMFVQLENGQPADKLPNKHTVILAPGDTYSALLTANEAGEWAFHCHMIYHMLAGMMTKVVVARTDLTRTSPTRPAHHEMKHDRGTMDHGSHGSSPSSAEKSVEHSGHSETSFKQDARAKKEHGGQVFHSFRLEMSGGSSEGKGTVDWDFGGWIGTDENKLWLKSEGERTDGRTEQAEFRAMYSRNIASFWDAQIGVRYDIEPTSLAYLTLGVEGLAPYFFETQVHLFVSEDKDVSVRLHLENDFLITQRLILQPYIEADLYAQDVPERDIGAGLTGAEFGLQTRYEVARKFAPYVDLKYERKLGETSSLLRERGEDNDAVIITAGIRFLF